MRSVVLSCLLSLAALHVASAEEEADPPGRVARLSYMDGDVSMAPAGTEEWADAVLNRPLTTGDRLWVDNGARAELQTGNSTVYVDQSSGFSFVDLDDDQMHMSLTDGAITVRVRRQRDDEHIFVDTPNASVSLLKPGEYHIEVAEGGATTIVRTRSGESEVVGEKNTYHIPANEEGIFKGTNELTADVNPIPPRTAFEDWATERERRGENSQSERYVSNEVVGYEDLDDNGDWVSEPEYGYVWYPRTVAVGWAPYRYGRWAWVAPWGWSWIDDTRWGFAPFHYGRWAYARDRWCWVPGPRHIRPVYAPALVGWVGSPGVSVSVSIGSGVGWFPLGPREVFVPGYRHSPRYIRNVNVSNTVIVNNTYVTNIYNGRGTPRDYRYGRMANAVTVVQRDQFVGGRPLGGHFSRVNDNDLRNWRQDARPPAVVPNRQSVFASNIAARQPAARDVRMNLQGRLQDRTPPARMSFDAEQRAIEANQGRPVDRSQLFQGGSRQRGGAAPAELAAGKGPGSVGEADRNAQRRSGPIKPGATQQGMSQQSQQQSGSAPNTNDRLSGTGSLRNNRDTQRDVQNDRSRDPATEQGTQRQVHDRPDWARSRDNNAQSGSAQSGSGSVVPSHPPAEARRDDSFRSAQPDGSQWRGNDTPKRVERSQPRAAQQNEVHQEAPVQRSEPRQSDRPPSYSHDDSPKRSYQQPSRPVERAPAPQYSAPREQPQPRVERSSPPPQPQRQEQPRQQNQQNQQNQQSQPKSDAQRPSGNKFREQQH